MKADINVNNEQIKRVIYCSGIVIEKNYERLFKCRIQSIRHFISAFIKGSDVKLFKVMTFAEGGVHETRRQVEEADRGGMSSVGDRR
jgi:hypothetical protein